MLFFVFSLFSIKGKPQLHFLVQQPGLAHRKSLGVCNPPWKLRVGDYLLPSFRSHVCSWYCWASCQGTSRKGEVTEREVTTLRGPHSSDPAQLTRGVRLGGADSWLLRAPGAHTIVTTAALLWEENHNLSKLALLLLISKSLEKPE